MTFLLLTSIKFTSSQLRYVQIPYTEFRTNQAVNVGTEAENHAHPLVKNGCLQWFSCNWPSHIKFLWAPLVLNFVGTSCTELCGHLLYWTLWSPIVLNFVGTYCTELCGHLLYWTLWAPIVLNFVGTSCTELCGHILYWTLWAPLVLNFVGTYCNELCGHLLYWTFSLDWMKNVENIWRFFLLPVHK
jgi:hypothetical protein